MVGTPSLPDKRYDILYADPPWGFTRSGSLHVNGMYGNALDHYHVLTDEEIKRIPVPTIMAESCLMFGWVVQSQMNYCIDVFESWGFQYSTVGFVWDKLTSKMGYYTHPQVELCLIFKHGTPNSEPYNTDSALFRGSRNEKQIVYAPRKEHSRKPDAIAHAIERLYPRASRVELFARTPRPGWDTWGDQAEGVAWDVAEKRKPLGVVQQPPLFTVDPTRTIAECKERRPALLPTSL